MKRMLFNATYHEELRVALIDGQKLINFDIETNIKTQRRGNVYCGVITRVEPSLEACFVDYGTEKQGFLPFKEIDPAYMSENTRFRDYSKLTEGTKIIIQVEKDERGNKGAALTSYISLPGRYLVLMPNHPKSGGISRRIEGEERDELKALLSQLSYPNGMGVIARTAALGRVVEELQWDLNYLLKLWNAIKSAAQNHERALIYQESNLVIRSIRDHFAPDVEEILIDEEGIYNEARNFMTSIMPNFVGRIKYYHDDIQLFSRFQVEHQIESAYSRTVNLPSGGAIVIDHTEALLSVDVNSARANKGTDIEATALATNMEAAEEIARQLRLRDIGGLVVVDFIDMENSKNQRDVENHFKVQLGFDRARIQMGKLSKFGLLELSRQRLQVSLEETTTITCPRCSGIGVIRGIESIAVHILRMIQEEAVRGGNYIVALHVQIPVEVATYLLNEKRDDIVRIENRLKVRVMLIPNVHMNSPQYKIKRITAENYEYIGKKQSFNLVEIPESTLTEALSSNQAKDNKLVQKAAVKNVLPNQPAPVVNKSIFSIIANKLAKLFNPSNPSKPKSKHDNFKSKNVQNVSRTQQIKSSDKNLQNVRLRPVAINKSNTKIQTVRPSSRDAASTNKPVTNNNNNLMPKNVNIAEEKAKNTPSLKNNSENVKQVINKTTVTQKNELVKPTANKLNKPQPTVNLNTTVMPKVAEVVVQKVTEVNSTNFVNKEVDIIKEELVIQKVPVKNTILDPVDLGNLVIVNTNKKLQVEHQAINYTVAPKKRYNEREVAIETSRPEVQYELVETKTAN